jgi:endoglucanase
MKHLTILLVLLTVHLVMAETLFTRGVNLTGWLQKPGPGQIQFTEFTRQDLVNIKSLGCDVIRLPINLHAMTRGGPDYTIDPLFFFFLDQIVTWAEELRINLAADGGTLQGQVRLSVLRST